MTKLLHSLPYGENRVVEFRMVRDAGNPIDILSPALNEPGYEVEILSSDMDLVTRIVVTKGKPLLNRILLNADEKYDFVPDFEYQRDLYAFRNGQTEGHIVARFKFPYLKNGIDAEDVGTPQDALEELGKRLFELYLRLDSKYIKPNLKIHTLAESLEDASANIYRSVWNIMEWISQNVKTGYTSWLRSFMDASASNTLDSLCGVCADKTNLAVSLARSLEIPARYRVNQVVTDRNGKYKATHNWPEFYFPHFGWVACEANAESMNGFGRLREEDSDTIVYRHYDKSLFNPWSSKKTKGLTIEATNMRE